MHRTWILCWWVLMQYWSACLGQSSNDDLVEFVTNSVPYKPKEVRISADTQAWLAQENLANALNVDSIESVELPVYVNVFPIGLDGTGQLGVELSADHMSLWLEHLQHIVPQLVLPTTSNSQKHTQRRHGKGGGSSPGSGSSASAEAEHSHSSSGDQFKLDALDDSAAASESAVRNPLSLFTSEDASAGSGLPAQINYRYYYRLIQVSGQVTPLIETYLASTFRLQDSLSGEADEEVTVQVDPEGLVAMLDNLVNHLDLQDAYNVFILNPRRMWVTDRYGASARYGYRVGFSNEEINWLLESTSETSLQKDFTPTGDIPDGVSIESSGIAVDKQTEAFTSIPTPSVSYPNTQNKSDADVNLAVHDYVHWSAYWAEHYAGAGSAQGPLMLEAYFTQLLARNPHYIKSNSGNHFLSENCMTDNWVGGSRTSFLDLSAGPFHWGPIVGGEGVRTNTSFPSVSTFASATKGQVNPSGDAVAANAAVSGPRFSVGYDWDKIEMELVVLKRRLEGPPCLLFLQYLKGHLTANPTATIGSLNASSFRAIIPEQLVSRADVAKCLTYRQMQDSLEKFRSDQERSEGFVKQPVPFDAEGAFSFWSDGEQEGHIASLEADQFMAHLSGSVSSLLTQVLTPAIADTALLPGSGFHQRVSFQLYVLADHKEYDPLENWFFPRFRKAVDQLRMPGQTFSYTVTKLYLDDDVGLTMAFVNSLRSSVIPSLLFDGHFSAIRRTYLDSSVLQNELLRMEMLSASGAGGGGGGTQSGTSKPWLLAQRNTPAERDIPVFIFSLDSPTPVFVDEHHQARGLSNMVLAVQSGQHLWESHLTCNRFPVFVNLRNPLSALVAAVAQTLGGLVPRHLSYSTSHQRVSQEWAWSVGASPLSLTSHELEFSAMDVDAVHRNYIVAAVRQVTSSVNKAVRRLMAQRTTAGNQPVQYSRTKQWLELDGEIAELAKDQGVNPAHVVPPATAAEELTDVRYTFKLYFAIRLRLHKLWDAFDAYNFDLAVQDLPNLARDTAQFVAAVDGLLQEAKRLECQTTTPMSSPAAGAGSVSSPATPNPKPSSSAWRYLVYWQWLSWPYYVGVALFTLLAVLYRLINPPKSKPKLN